MTEHIDKRSESQFQPKKFNPPPITFPSNKSETVKPDTSNFKRRDLDAEAAKKAADAAKKAEEEERADVWLGREDAHADDRWGDL